MNKNVLIVLLAVCGVVACAHQGGNEVMTAASPEPEKAISTSDFEDAEGDIEVPPEGALPLSEIIASVEVGSHISIVEVEFEDGAWEIEYVVGGEVHELHVDPMSGEPLDDEGEESDED